MIISDLFHWKKCRFFLLLSADDTVFFSRTQQGLQILLNKLNSYCNKWGIYVNMDKTIAMIFKAGNRPENIGLFYDMKIVTSFAYLGVTLSSNAKFYQSRNHCLARQLRLYFH